jgi:hypothetical protein
VVVDFWGALGDARQSIAQLAQLYGRRSFILLSVQLSRGVPGEGPDDHVLSKINGSGPVPARIWGIISLISWPPASAADPIVGGAADACGGKTAREGGDEFQREESTRRLLL